MAHKKAKTTGTGGGKSRYMTRAEAKDGARVRRRREDKRSHFEDCDSSDCAICEEESRRAYEEEEAARAAAEED